MATWTFLTNAPAAFTINNLAGSGLAFAGSAFAASVAVGSYQDTTWVSDGNGLTQGPQTNNIKWLNAASGTINSASSGVHLLSMPNYLSTLICEFSHGSAVRLQNTKVYIYDRYSTANAPSGVTCKVAEIIHPSINGIGNTGSGSPIWYTPAGSSYLALSPSPGRSGLYINGPSTTDTIHDHYLNITASPNSIGSKTQFGLLISTEYL